jgi:hypothetical protein
MTAVEVKLVGIRNTETKALGESRRDATLCLKYNEINIVGDPCCPMPAKRPAAHPNVALQHGYIIM